VSDNDGYLKALVRVLYGDKGVTAEADDASKLRAVAVMFDRIDDATEAFLEVPADPQRRQMQRDLEAIARKIEANS
jgi:hypothetical protein